MKCIDRFKKRVTSEGITTREREISRNDELFERFLKENATATRVQLTDVEEAYITDTTKWVDCSVTDYACNDRRFLDEKLFCVRGGTNVDLGCYFRWQGKDWLLIFEEHNTVSRHRTFVARPCNVVIDVIYEGKKVPISALMINLTLYSHGLSFDKYQTRENGKRTMMMGRNIATRTFHIGRRIMLNQHSTFMISHIDDFTYTGMISFTLLQTPVSPNDDKEDNVAFNKEQTLTKDVSKEKDDLTKVLIKGNTEICIGDTNKYKLLNYSEQVYWNLLFEKKKEEYVTINQKEDGTCEVKVKGNARYVGSSFVLQAIDKTSKQTIKEIPIEVTIVT